MAHIPLRMILSKPRQFFNVTPINRMGITVVDLGDIDDGSEAPRSSSLPPTSVKLFEDIIPRESRHSSLPRTTEDKVRRSTSRLTSEESDGNAEETRETGPHSDPGSESDNDSSRGTPDEDSKASLRSSHGEMISRTSAIIKKEDIKTWWFMVLNKKAIAKPPLLHTSVKLELGDLFINRFYSKERSAHVLQVWLLELGKRSEQKVVKWRQISPSEKPHHPKLKHRVLAFQPSDTNVPTWILANTDRRQRNMPLIVL